jgi:hypothetical protein
MRLSCRAEIALNPEVQRNVSGCEPGTTTPREGLRFLELGETQNARIEAPGSLFTALRHRELHVVKSDELHRTGFVCCWPPRDLAVTGASAPEFLLPLIVIAAGSHNEVSCKVLQIAPAGKLLSGCGVTRDLRKVQPIDFSIQPLLVLDQVLPRHHRNGHTVELHPVRASEVDVLWHPRS